MIAAVQLHELRRISDHELHAAPIDRFAHLCQIERLQAEALTADTAVEAVDQRLPVTRGRRIAAHRQHADRPLSRLCRHPPTETEQQ